MSRTMKTLSQELKKTVDRSKRDLIKNYAIVYLRTPKERP